MSVQLTNIDLAADPAAALYIKDEEVEVRFATKDGELPSREGPNRYQAGDAIVSGATGDRWSVSGERFAAKYVPLAPTAAGQDGRYRARPVPVLAKQIHTAFSAARSSGGDVLHGEAGDWLLQYAPGDFGVAASGRFAAVYRPYRP